MAFLFTFSHFSVIFCSLEDKVWLIFQRYLNNLELENKYTQQRTLAKKIGVSRTVLLACMKLVERQPDFETSEVIADFFNVDMDYLLGKKY
ncbi:MAG: helix-turn-helix domain-containing protein [Segatella copri]